MARDAAPKSAHGYPIRRGARKLQIRFVHQVGSGKSIRSAHVIQVTVRDPLELIVDDGVKLSLHSTTGFESADPALPILYSLR